MKIHKGYILAGLTILVIAGAAIFGMSKRGSYTDIQSDPAGMNSLQVAELPEALTENIEDIVSILEECPVILQVKVLSERDYLFYSAAQDVVIEKIYTGDGKLEVNQEIKLTSGKWLLSVNIEPASLECGYVNVMQPGKSYLVFLSGSIESMDKNEIVYSLYDELVIAPVFALESHENKAISVSGDTTYVSYLEVKDNEFFSDSQKGMENLEAKKEKLFEKYRGM